MVECMTKSGLMKGSIELRRRALIPLRLIKLPKVVLLGGEKLTTAPADSGFVVTYHPLCYECGFEKHTGDGSNTQKLYSRGAASCALRANGEHTISWQITGR